MADTKISAATDAGTLLATDMLPLARAGSTSAYHATMTEIGAFTNATLPVASTTVPGVVKVDGSTITIASGVISGVSPAPYGSLPAMDGAANAGAVSAWSRGDHVHPTDSTRAPLASPAMTGTPTAPTPTTGDNSTKLATTAFVQAQMVASGAGVSTWNTRAGAVVLQQSDLVAQGDFHDAGRNLVMNGAFAVAQRGAGAFSTSGAYTADRWAMAFAGGITSVTVASAGTGGIAGDESSKSWLSAAVTGTAGTNDYSQVYQPIEDVRRLAGKTVTVSFYAFGPSAGSKLGLGMSQSFGTGGSPSASVTLAGQSVTLTTAWARYFVTFAVPSASGKIFGTNGNDCTYLQFFYSAGSGVAGTGSPGVQSGTFGLWGIQLEIGSVATPFDAGGTPADQIRQCQRYYQILTAKMNYYSGATGAAFGYANQFPVQMRSVPSVAFANTTYNNASGITLDFATNTAVSAFATTTATGAAANFKTDIQLSADL